MNASPDLVRAAVVARRFFIEGLTKQAIGQQLGISRFKVARLLDLARSHGIVHIDIHAPFSVDVALSRALEEAFHLDEAWVLDAGDVGPAELRAEVGRLGAVMVSGLAEPGDVIGISWGRTMRALVDALPPLPPASVVQVAGGLPAGLEDHALELVRRVAARTAGDSHVLHAPLFVEDPATAASLRAEPQIARTLAIFPRLTTVVLGLGAWDPTQSPVASALSPHDVQRLRRAGAIAEVCGLFITDDGEVLNGDLAARSIAISADELRSVKQVVAVAGGREKADAVRAVLGARICSRLVTDRSVAETLVEGI